MKILVTGSNGFIAKNLIQFLSEKPEVEVLKFNRSSTPAELEQSVLASDWIVHLAGINRPLNEQEFIEGNITLTQKIADILKQAKKQTPVILSSSIQAERDNAYGQSKLGGEQVLLELNQQQGNPVYICRLANVFGKWSRPNYNSAVATFCYNTAHDLPIQIHDENAMIRLVYVDDVVESFWNIIEENDDNIRSFLKNFKIFNDLVSSLCHSSMASSNLSAAESGAIPRASFQIRAALFVSITRTSYFLILSIIFPRGAFLCFHQNAQ